MHDALFGHILTETMDVEEMERQRIRRHVFMARYGRQSMVQWADVDGRTVRQYAQAMSDFLEEENAAVKRATTQSE